MSAQTTSDKKVSAAMVELTTEKEVDELLRSDSRAIINCHAEWAVPCAQMNAVFATLQGQIGNVTFATLEAERHAALAKRFDIRSVPTFLFLAQGRVVRVQSGADAAALTRSARWLGDASDDALLTAACETAIATDEIVVLLKGSASSPKCAFCSRVIEKLQRHGIVFRAVDVLLDGRFRERVKEVARWETFPMVFARGRLVGGVDAVCKLADEDRLVAELARGEHEPMPDVGSDRSGSKTEAPAAAASRARTAAARGSGAEGDVQEAEEEEEEESEEALQARLSALSRRAGVMVFMKGTPDGPRCGFSRRLVALLHESGVSFESFDVLTDHAVRQGMKAFAQWPTFPQVFAGGRFVGGLDVVKELAELGELRAELGLAA